MQTNNRKPRHQAEELSMSHAVVPPGRALGAGGRWQSALGAAQLTSLVVLLPPGAVGGELHALKKSRS